MQKWHDILHIVPHAGGGVGAVLRAILAAETTSASPYRHSVASLEYLNSVTKAHCDSYGIAWIDEAAGPNRAELDKLLIKADMVLIHWWNHPLLMELLVSDLPAMRLAMWSHVNGYFAPQVFIPSLFGMADLFVFSSETSLKAPAVIKLDDKDRAKLRVIRSCSGIPPGSEEITPKREPFIAGYVGTVESGKMHNDFLTICADADLPSLCIVAGGPDHEELRRKAEAMQIADRFSILGPLKDPIQIYRQIHAFAYPLTPRHYGTGEQVLIEAMAYGAVPVVMANPPEEAIITDGVNGLIARDRAAFSAALRCLMENPRERDRLAKGGHDYVMQECGIEHSIKAFHELFAELLSFAKVPRRLRTSGIEGIKHESPLHLFMEALGETEERAIFDKLVQQNVHYPLPAAFASKTRGTAFHYQHMLAEDQQLNALCKILETQMEYCHA